MSLANLSHWFFGGFGCASQEDRAATGLKPSRSCPPIFIQDAVIPWQGKTLLRNCLGLTLMRPRMTPDLAEMSLASVRTSAHVLTRLTYKMNGASPWLVLVFGLAAQL